VTKIGDDYVEVAERRRMFFERYPEGSLQSLGDPKLMVAGEKTFLVYCAAAYRSPDDAKPGIGWAWEPVPGTTPWTKDSELQNAETSAWGRAILAACGIESKKIASREEVENRRGQQAPDPLPSSGQAPPTVSRFVDPGEAPTEATKQLLKDVMAALKDLNPTWDVKDLARTITQTKYNKQDSALLTDLEMRGVILALERKLAQGDPGPVDEQVPSAV
jgi:hypothetical protein